MKHRKPKRSRPPMAAESERVKSIAAVEHLAIDRIIEMRARTRTLLAFLLFVITGSALAETSDIGKDDHPPELTRTFSGVVQRVDASTLTVSRQKEKHIFLLGDCSEAPRVKVPASSLHRPILVTYVGGREPYCAVKVQVLSALPKPTPRQDDTPIRYTTGVMRSLNGDHLIIRAALDTHQFVIDALTVYYDREGYVVLNPHPAADLPEGTRVNLGYTGNREPFRARSVQILE